MAIDKSRYPKNWSREIRPAILARARDRCEACGVLNYSWRFTWHPPRLGGMIEGHMERGPQVVLTISHNDHTPENCEPQNLRALCQRCHLAYDHEYHRSESKKTKARKAADRPRAPELFDLMETT